MTQSSRPQAENRNNGFVDSGPYSGDEWRFRMRAAHTGDLNTAAARSRIRGVVPTYDNMLVTTVVGTTVTVGTGAGLVSGSYLFNDTEVDFDLDTVANRPALNSRIDILCMVENNTNLPATNGAAANGWVFPTVLTDYDGAAIPAYSARLVIVKGAEAAVPAAPVLDILNTLFMVPVYEYLVSPVPAISDEVDRREFADVEIIVGAHTDADDETHDALILGAVVNNGFGAAGLGAGVKFRLEDDAGLLADAGQLAVRSSDPTTTAEQTRMELRLRAGGADNLSAVINAPTAASVDGDARGAGAVDLQQNRQVVTEVASGAYSFLAAGVENTASGDYAAVVAGAENVASGDYALVSGLLNEASGDYSTVPGGQANDVASAHGVISGGFNNSTVVAGVYSAISGGRNNTITGGGSDAAIGGGEGNDVSGNSSVIGGGRSNTVSGSDSVVAGGASNTVTGGGAAVCGGSSNLASGENSVVTGGTGNTASELYASAGGGYSIASKTAQFARASGRISASGDAQYSDYHVLRAVTHSDAAWYPLYLGAFSPITLAADTVYTFDCLLVGTSQGCAKSFGFRIVGAIENDGGTTTLLGSTVTTIYDADDVSFDARARADDALDALIIEVSDSDAAGDIVRWSAVVRTAEVTFPA